MQLKPNRIFIESVARDFKRTGAVAPSSKALAHAITRELAQHCRRPATVLEVGAGTGSITEEIIKYIGAGDRLDIYEIDRKFAGVLRHRVLNDASFQGGAQIRVHNKAIERIDRLPKYDFIISCLPFTNFEPEAVRNIFELYRSVLVPGGICSFYEYIFIRDAARMMSGNPAQRERFAGVSRVVRSYTARFSYRHHIVLRNLPPATVHHIRFSAN